MSLLEVSGLTMSYADKELYNDASFRLEKHEHMGIIGQNGAGKSTLIKILIGQVLPVAGTVKWQPGTTRGYLDQYVDIPQDETLLQFLHSAYAKLYQLQDKLTKLYADPQAMADPKQLEKAGQMQDYLESHGFYDIDTKVAEVMSGLGLTELGEDRLVGKMSGGQRSKLILAKLLLQNPDVILLDEPTNYLDTAHIAWLVDYLNQFDCAAMIISHDYDFLEKVTTTICDVSFGKITKYRGSFQQAMRQKAERQEAQERKYEKQQEVIEKATRFIRKNKAGRNSNMAKSREKMLARMTRVEPPSTNLKASFHFPYEESGSANALRVDHLSVGYNRPLLKPVTFSLTMGEKMLFSGFNGVGKTTLIRTILGELPAKGGTATFSPSAKVNYFDQNLTWDNPNLTPLQTIQNLFPTMQPKTIRTKLARAGINAANAAKPLHQLSGGEQTKVKIAVLELTPCNFLIMDEPTNHLDDETKDGLKRALQEFPGNLLLVSHEESFTSGWLDKVLNVEKLSLRKQE